MRLVKSILVPVFVSWQLLASLGSAQEYEQGGYEDYESYQDYADPYGQQDNLYADYAAHQQVKETGGGNG
jgi:hypothetical protein